MGVCSVNASWEIIGRSLGDHSRDHEEIIGGIPGEITRVHKIGLIVGVDDDLVTISLQSRASFQSRLCFVSSSSKKPLAFSLDRRSCLLCTKA